MCLVSTPYLVCLQAQGMVKDLEPVLLRHLAQGTASLLITTKSSPRGELRGQVCEDSAVACVLRSLRW